MQNSYVSHDSHMTSLILAVHACRSMGENLEEVEEFDRRMQSVAEGTYHPSHSAMETFPVRCDSISLQNFNAYVHTRLRQGSH